MFDAALLGLRQQLAEQHLLVGQQAYGHSGRWHGFGAGHVDEALARGRIHAQGRGVRQLLPRLRQHRQAPGVDVAAIGHGALLQPVGTQPGQIQPRAQNGDGAGQLAHGRQVVLALVVFDQQQRREGLDEAEPERGGRCTVCYRLRMRRAAQYAAEHGFDWFTTTLSISPHKDAKRINAIGQELEAEFGVKHLPSDFKKHNGYLRSLQLSEEYGLYRQDYCGCEFSAKARGIEKY